MRLFSSKAAMAIVLVSSRPLSSREHATSATSFSLQVTILPNFNCCHLRNRRRARRGTARVLSTSINANEDGDGGDGGVATTSKRDDGPCVLFPGGGLFFYWQAGAIAHLREGGYDLPAAPLAGASAGALSATLAKSAVSPYDATELALSMSEEAGVWERPLGLQGVWGGIIREWLDRLLPPDAAGAGDLHVLLTPVPSFGKRRVCRFVDRRDLIDANMASVHLPWFLDGNWTADFRGRPHVDGSFLARPSDYFPAEYSDRPKLVLDFKRDPIMRDRASDFVRVVSKQTIWDILEQGRIHAKIMEKRGEFDLLWRR